MPLADERGVCMWNCEIPWERVPYLSALEVWCSRHGAIQIHLYLYLYLYLSRMLRNSNDAVYCDCGPISNTTNVFTSTQRRSLIGIDRF